MEKMRFGKLVLLLAVEYICELRECMNADFVYWNESLCIM